MVRCQDQMKSAKGMLVWQSACTSLVSDDKICLQVHAAQFSMFALGGKLHLSKNVLLAFFKWMWSKSFLTVLRLCRAYTLSPPVVMIQTARPVKGNAWCCYTWYVQVQLYGQTYLRLCLRSLLSPRRSLLRLSRSLLLLFLSLLRLREEDRRWWRFSLSRSAADQMFIDITKD